MVGATTLAQSKVEVGRGRKMAVMERGVEAGR